MWNPEREQKSAPGTALERKSYFRIDCLSLFLSSVSKNPFDSFLFFSSFSPPNSTILTVKFLHISYQMVIVIGPEEKEYFLSAWEL